MLDSLSQQQVTSGPRRRLRLSGYLISGGLLLTMLLLVTLFAPLLTQVDPNLINPAVALKSFGFEGHVLGTDNLGRDLLSRLLFGGRISLVSSVLAAFISTLIGTLLGVLGAFYRRGVDTVILRLTDILMAFPFILLAILIVAALGPSTFNALLAVAISNIPFTVRLVRSEAVRLREREFITAARALGANDRRIIWRHLFPNILGLLISTLFMTTGWMLGQTSALSFLGLGTQPPTADWGSMLAESQNYMATLPEVAMLPGVMIVLTVVALNLFGLGLRALALRET